MKQFSTLHALGEKLRFVSRVPSSTLRYGSRFSSQIALKYKTVLAGYGIEYSVYSTNGLELVGVNHGR